MKMNRQNPGGEIVTRPTMKGCEFGMDKGKGSGVGGSLQTKYSTQAPGLSGVEKGGHANNSKHKGGHALTSFSGETVTGTSRAAK